MTSHAGDAMVPGNTSLASNPDCMQGRYTDFVTNLNASLAQRPGSAPVTDTVMLCVLITAPLHRAPVSDTVLDAMRTRQIVEHEER